MDLPVFVFVSSRLLHFNLLFAYSFCSMFIYLFFVFDFWSGDTSIYSANSGCIQTAKCLWKISVSGSHVQLVPPSPHTAPAVPSPCLHLYMQVNITLGLLFFQFQWPGGDMTFLASVTHSCCSWPQMYLPLNPSCFTFILQLPVRPDGVYFIFNPNFFSHWSYPSSLSKCPSCPKKLSMSSSDTSLKYLTKRELNSALFSSLALL